MTAAYEPDRHDFCWFSGIPARNWISTGRHGDVPVRVTWLTMLGYLRIEELDGQAMPVRTLVNADVAGKVHVLKDIEAVLAGLGIEPAATSDG